MASTTAPRDRADLKALIYRPEVRQIVYQVALLALLAFAAYWVVNNVAANLRRQNIASGFDFLGRTAGFDIGQSLIEYANVSSYGRAILVGLLNTLLVAGLGIVAATVLGFVIGIARLSSNWLIARLATAYVETLRNLPLLLQLFFWYFAVLKGLPSPRQAFALPGGVFLNVRGFNLPALVPEPGFTVVVTTALAVGLALAVAIWWWAKRRQRLTGQRFPIFWTALLVIVGLPLAAFLAAGAPLSLDYPELRGFNFQGGINVQPELVALWLGLSTYTASFIAEIVRAGILGVAKGQTEAAQALGLSRGQTLRLVVVPQASRIVIPPLTSQYLNLIKNSSLAVAIGYPDFVSVTGTVLNQTGQAVEVILMTMSVYLLISLVTSTFMNWFNRRMALVER